MIPNNILELLKESKSLSEKSNELSSKLNEIANRDERPSGLVSDRIKQSDEFKKAKSDFNEAFQKEREFNSSAKGKELQKYLSKLDRMERMEIRRMKFYDGGVVEYVLWATPIGKPMSDERIAFVDNEEIKINQRLIDLLKSKGYDRPRVAKMNMMEKPDFTKTIKKANGGTLELNNPQKEDLVDFGEGLEIVTRILSFPNGKTYIESVMADGSDDRRNLYPIEEWNDVVSKQDIYKSRTDLKARERQERERLILESQNKELKEKMEYEDVDGFADKLSPMQRAKVLQYLNKSFFGKERVKDKIRSLVSTAFIKDYNGKPQIRYDKDDGTFILDNKYQTKASVDYLNYLKGLNKYANGGTFAKGGIIGSSPTLDGIKKIIGNYYYSNNISLQKINDTDEYEVHNAKGKINSVKVIEKKGRFQFVNVMAEGGTINKQINNNNMDNYKFNQLPHIDTLNSGDSVLIEEGVFSGNIDNPKHVGDRYIHCKVMGKGGVLDTLDLKVVQSVGANALMMGSVITRPIRNVLQNGRKLIVEPIGNAVTNFKDGGINADNKEVKEYFAHGSGNVGGVLVGKRHSEGGIKAVNKSSGQPLEMEGGEVVITRGAVSNPKRYDFNGKELTTREILSKLNVDGGGVSFAEGGDVPDKINCGCNHMKFGGMNMTPQDFVKHSEGEYEKYRLQKGVEKEKKDHYETLAKLNAGTITIDNALTEIARKEMSLDSKYPFSE
jgi:hypothetical protein